MQLNQLIRRITDYPIEYYGNLDQDYDLQSVRYLTRSATKLNKYSLYLANTARLPEPGFPVHICIFCYGERVDFSKYIDSSFTLVYLGEKVASPELFNELLEQLTEVEQITAGLHVLSNALFSDKGLQNLVDNAAEVFDNPVYVVDLQGKYLAISEGFAESNSFLSRELKNGYIGETGLRTVRSADLDGQVRRTGKAYYFKNPEVGTGMLVDAIYIQGIEVGHIMLQESNHPFGSFDSELFHRFASLVAMELQKSSFFTRNRGVMYSFALADLLGSHDVNYIAVRNNFETLGYKLKHDLYLMVLPFNNNYTSDLRADIILQTIQGILPGSIYAVYEDTMVFLFSKEEYKGFTDYERARLKEFLTANHIYAGISNFFTDLQDAPRFYRQAVSAASLGSRMDPGQPLYYYRDYYIFAVLKTLEQSDPELRFLIQPGLIRLQNYDKEKGSDFLRTLGVFLSYPGQPSRVAEELHVHKNTLLYRMKKIREITHCSFEEGEQCMGYYISYKILDYLGMLDDRVKHREFPTLQKMPDENGKW